MSRNDIVLLAWGSRSMSSVRLPRSASAAARLMAVVVLPTPPFWLAMATIIQGWRILTPSSSDPLTQSSHLVLAELVRVEAFEPFVEPVGVVLVRREVDRLRVI